MYKLVIHHDIGVTNKDGSLQKDTTELGHVYLELKENGDSAVYGVISGYGLTEDSKYSEYRPHNKERLEIAREYESVNPNQTILHSREINITQLQYLEAMVLLDDYNQYTGQVMPTEKYGIIFNNCAHFVNHIYRSMGLEGDYTRHYKESELENINTWLTRGYKVLGFNAGDKAFTVFGTSIEAVAEKYNVDVSMVTKKESLQGIPDMEIAMMEEALDQIRFEIAPNPELVNSAQSDHDSVDEESKRPEDDEECSILSPNKIINEKVAGILSDPEKLKKYQETQISEAMEGLNILYGNLGSDIQNAAKETKNEHGDFLKQLLGHTGAESSILDPAFANIMKNPSNPNPNSDTSKKAEGTPPDLNPLSFLPNIRQEDMDFAQSLAASSASIVDNIDENEIMNLLGGNMQFDHDQT